MKGISAAILLSAFLSAAPAAAQGDVHPGQWDLTVEFSVPASPGVQLPPIQNRQCLTAQDARDPSRLFMQKSNPAASGCSFSDKRESPGHFEFSVKCEGTLGIAGRGSVDYTPTSMQGTLDLDFGQGGDSSRRVQSVTHFTARRVGDC